MDTPCLQTAAPVWLSCLVVSSQQLGLDGLNMLHHIFRGGGHSDKLFSLGSACGPLVLCLPSMHQVLSSKEGEEEGCGGEGEIRE